MADSIRGTVGCLLVLASTARLDTWLGSSRGRERLRCPKADSLRGGSLTARCPGVLRPRKEPGADSGPSGPNSSSSDWGRSPEPCLPSEEECRLELRGVDRRARRAAVGSVGSVAYALSRGCVCPATQSLLWRCAPQPPRGLSREPEAARLLVALLALNRGSAELARPSLAVLLLSPREPWLARSARALTSSAELACRPPKGQGQVPRATAAGTGRC